MDNQIKYTFLSVGADKVAGDIERISKLGNRAVATAGRMGSTASTGASRIEELGKSSKEAAKATDDLSNATDRASKKQSNYFAHIARTTIQSALINKAFLGLTDSLARATRQVDLIENFPGVMGALGVSTDEASVGMAKLRTYVEGVGGDLSAAAASVARFVAVNKSLEGSVAMYAGINNALIAGGAEATAQQAALEQLTQGYARGRIEGEEFRSMQTAMNLAMTEAAHALNMPSTQHLQEALNNGEISLNNFMATLAHVSMTGPVADTAMAQMQGIGFAMTVMSNTLTNGLTAIYQAVGRQNIIAFFSVLTQVISVLASWVVTAINLFIRLFNVISGLFGGPQIGNLKGETGGVASNLGAGAANAGDMADGIGDAGKAAKKLSKHLAGFDKMNVLPDPAGAGSGGSGGGGGGGGAGGGGPFSPGDMDLLKGIFDGITPKLQEISTFAKILAGIIAGIAGIKFAQGILNQLNGIGKTISETRSNLRKLREGFGKLGKTAETNSNKAGKSLSTKLGSVPGSISSTMSGVVGGIIGSFVSLLPRIGSIFGRLPSLIGLAFGKVGTAIRIAMIPAIAIIGGIAAALGVPFTVAAGIVAVAIGAIVGLIWLIWDNWQLIWTFITETASNFWTWLTEVWAGIVDVFAGPFQIAWQIISSIFILLVAVVAITLESIYKILIGIGSWVWNNVIKPVGDFFASLWNGVVAAVKSAWDGMINILKLVGSWIYDNVIKPVLDFFVSLWKSVLDTVVGWWNSVMNVLRPIINWISVTIINPISNFFKGLWDGIIGFIKTFINNWKNFFLPIINWINSNIIKPIRNFFSGLWNGIKNGLKSMIDGLGAIFGRIINIAKSPINGVIDLINGALGNLNKIKVPDWVPGLGGARVNFPKIPRLARGGVVNRPILAEIGEAGAEAVVPLENNTEWIDKLAKKINGRGGGEPTQIVVQIGEDKIADLIVELINEKTQMTGRTVINV